MSHKGGLYSLRLRSNSKRGGTESEGGGGGTESEGGGGGGGDMSKEEDMKFKHMLVQRMQITEAVAEDIVHFFKIFGYSDLFQRLTILFDYARGFQERKAAVIDDVVEAMRIHKECMREKPTEHQEFPSSFSRLTLSSSSSSRVPITYHQDRGPDAHKLPVRSHDFPVEATDEQAEGLWPAAEWDEVLQQEKGCEAKFIELLAKQEQRVLPEAVNSVFVKGRRGVCGSKCPDFFLVAKDNRHPTPATVGAILCAQSTTESSNSYCSDCAVGEAMSYAQKLLRGSSSQRNFVMVGVTNFRKLRWFKIYRGMDDGSLNGVQDDEVGLYTRHSLAGFMLCPLDQLGICERSVSSRAGRFPLGPFLGEGLTSNVYGVCINNEHLAVKIAKEGCNLSADVKYLSTLKGVRGIPSIVDELSDSKVVFMRPVCQRFSIQAVCSNNFRQCVRELVDVLQAAHNRLIVNRDARIENIMVAEGRLFFVDWGFAAFLHEDALFAGTTSYASDRVLKLLESGSEQFVFKPSDDLVSLVRALYIHSRWSSDYREHLASIRSDDYSGIRKFWLEYFCLKNDSKTGWFLAQRLAEDENYSGLKDWMLSTDCFSV